MITMKMQKTKKVVPIRKNQEIKKDDNNDILIGYMDNIDDKLFKKYSNVKNFGSFINKFDRTTNEEDKKKLVKEVKDINNLVEHDIEMDENSEYIFKLFDVVNATNYFLYKYSKKGSGLKN